MNVSMNPNYIEDLNASDYVCMTRSASQSMSKLAPLNMVATPPLPNSKVMSIAQAPVSSTAMKLTSKNLQTLQQEQLNSNSLSQFSVSSVNDFEKASSTSPTPSQLSNNSNKRECSLIQHSAFPWQIIKIFHFLEKQNLPPKPLLPFNVTQRPASRSEAERKIEELTRQLEEEMERSEDQGEYFGICHTCSEKVTGAGQACQAMGNLYHTNCFICCSCGRALRGKAFYNVHGRVYCEEDYMVIFSNKFTKWSQPDFYSILITFFSY